MQQPKQPQHIPGRPRPKLVSEINVSQAGPQMGIETIGYRLGYARVSTLEQDEALQRDALRAAGCDRIFVNKASGKVERRSALDNLLEQFRPGDSLVVWRTGSAGLSGISSTSWSSSTVGAWPFKASPRTLTPSLLAAG